MFACQEKRSSLLGMLFIILYRCSSGVVVFTVHFKECGTDGEISDFIPKNVKFSYFVKKITGHVISRQGSAVY